MFAPRIQRRRELYRLASSRGGYITAAQARDLGYSYQAQAHHVHVGNWDRVDRGLFRLPELPVDRHDDLIRATLWSRRRGVVSHESAAAVHEFAEIDSLRVHLTVPPGSPQRPARSSSIGTSFPRRISKMAQVFG